MNPSTPENNHGMPQPSFREFFWLFFKIGWIGFGGPAGQIALLHAEVVEKKRWVEDARFSQALNYCMLLPGPEAQQLATFLGWFLGGTPWALVSGTLFVLPAAILMWMLSWVFMEHGDSRLIQSFLLGAQPAVLAIITSSVYKFGLRSCRSTLLVVWAIASFVMMFFLRVPFHWIVIASALLGILLRHQLAGDIPSELDRPCRVGHTWNRAIKLLLFGCFLWWTPIAAVGLWTGWDQTLFQLGTFFSKAAVLTFGGAYAILPAVAHEAVEVRGWLDASQIAAGIALAEATPGPLVILLQFVGFAAAWQFPVLGWHPLASATLGAAITTWVTFAPGTLLVLVGAPSVDRLRTHPWVSSALGALTAAVTGVILNLAYWFGARVLVGDTGIDWASALFSVVALVAILRWKLDPVRVLLAGMVFGLLRAVLG